MPKKVVKEPENFIRMRELSGKDKLKIEFDRDDDRLYIIDESGTTVGLDFSALNTFIDALLAFQDEG